MPEPTTTSAPTSRPADAPPEDIIIDMRNVHKSFGDNHVLRGISLDVERGTSAVVMGGSGTGKSVLIKHIVKLLEPDEGEIWVKGRRIDLMKGDELDKMRLSTGYLFQGGALFDSMTVAGNVGFPIREHTDWDEERILESVREKLALVELEGVEGKMPAELSGGMKKRVALARSLALDPEVILFDEPTTGLDPMTSATIAHLIRNTREQVETSAVIVTHDISLARLVASRVAFLEGGRFRFVGTWEELEATADPLVQRFVAGERESE
jgi:phospholipid/cholesterol/gamma-HCH transport system ATP-binding protein